MQFGEKLRAARLAARLTQGSLRHSDRASSLQPVLDALVQMLHAEVADPIVRRALHRTAVVRRVTISLLRALMPGADAHALLDALAALPMCSVAGDGLLIQFIETYVETVDTSGRRLVVDWSEDWS